MDKTLHVLLVEDSEDDALLLQRQLKRSGYNPTIHRVDTTEQLDMALQSPSWDVIITDHNLQGFGSDTVLQRVREAQLDIPVIIVSGTIGEDAAVSAMKAGASDYIMKDNLARLAPAIERELREAEVRHQHRKAEETIHHLAFHDSLTGLINRHRFEQRLTMALRTAKDWNTEHALLYLDLDQFKVVNDTCGHVAGDELLKQLALVLQEHVRESDTLARLGGDEFGLLLENCPIDQAVQVAEKLLQAINEFRFSWGGKTFSVGGSIGLAPITAHDVSVDDLMRNADIACYTAKDHGRNRLHVYRAEDAELQRRRGEMHWVSRIQWALENDRFALYRQSIVPLQKGRNQNTCCELLIRMRDEQDQLISPGVFLPAAERYNLSPAVDRWVVRHLLEFLTRNRELMKRRHGFFINLSGVTLNDDDFYDFLRQRLRATGVPPEMLCFEVTETAAIGNLSRAISFMQGVREEGCRFALDDFGAGLSSFSYLKAIPADYLKIDGAFVRDIVDDPLDHAIVESINRVGHVVGLETIAEFVENEAIRDRLSEIGVDYAQGYGLHRPEPMGNCA
ncbi:diguanylate cyclase (GGDEF)-like protein [Sulfuritortus calidifontis]|uniref:Diguanylate cyclase (GGDEF)-like protein n=1 Tax=Sulfuritortus calidifontis TaxID=1914471 RepID=A0A4R3JY57_9PROT|nr:EAL domain-containing protein [Sulfuritortus calidifontis]TCS72100.1 diguanylate cyclase (GGDEF)-like protein [Sulfuritortus calidifontis]